MPLSRRNLLLTIVGGAVESFRPQGGSAAGRIDISVADFGAFPDGTDASPGLRLAIARIPKSEPARLWFPPGRYSFFEESQPVMLLDGLTGLHVEGNDAVLEFRSRARPIVARNCKDLRLHNVRIDWNRPPFSQAEVVSVDDVRRIIDVRIDSRFSLNGEVENVRAIGSYEKGTALVERNGIDAYDPVDHAKLLPERVLRLWLKRDLPFRPGQILVLRHSFMWPHAVHLSNCSNVELANVTVYASPGMAIVGEQSHDLRLRGVRVLPNKRDGRIFSTCADALHFVSCSGDIEIADCELAAMGDDCLNVNTPYLRVHRRLNDRTITVTNKNSVPFGIEDVALPNDRFQFFTSSLNALGNAELVHAEPGLFQRLLFARDLPVEVQSGSLAFNVSRKASLRVSNCKFPGNRARGILGHSDVVIESCLFRSQSHTGILLQPDLTWLEGGSVRAVQIRNCTFEDVGRIKTNQSTIVINAIAHTDRSSTSQVNSEISITETNFINCNGPALYANSVQNLLFKKNKIDGASGPALILDDVRGVRILDNDCSPESKIKTGPLSSDVQATGNIGLILD